MLINHVRCTVTLLSDQSNKVQLLLTEFSSTFHDLNDLFLYLNSSVGVWVSFLFSLTLSGKNSSSGVHSQGFGAPADRKTHTDRGPVSSSSTLRSAVNPSSAFTDFRAVSPVSCRLIVSVKLVSAVVVCSCSRFIPTFAIAAFCAAVLPVLRAC